MLGMRAVYINPITAKEEITVALKRVPEHYVLKRFYRAGIQ
jgi:predicted HAD superfamily phosphohydrolase YqeG